MGRQEYLTRLALGRSAFEDEDAEQPPARPGADPSGALRITSSGHSPDQTWDNKGRPTNFPRDLHKAAMRRAQNEVLEQFGVVERKRDEDAQMAEDKWLKAQEARRALRLQQEYEGQRLWAIMRVIRRVAVWWPEVLIARSEAGIDLAVAAGFAGVVASQMQAATGSGKFWDAVAVLFAGAPAFVLHGTMVELLRHLLEHQVAKLQKLTIIRTRRSSTADRFNTLVLWTSEAVSILAQILLLLPLELHGTAQQLGLAPARPLIPSWRSFLPWNPSSVHQLQAPFAFHYWAFRALCAPSAMMLVRRYLDKCLDDPYPPMLTVLEWITKRSYFSQPGQLQPLNIKPHLLHRIESEIGLISSAALELVGWEADNPPQDEVSGDFEAAPPRAHRLRLERYGYLAVFPYNFLRLSIAGFLRRILLLPLDCLVHRTVAASYPISLLPKTSLALSRESPSIVSGYSWSGVGTYLSRIGLGIALHSSVEVGLFFAAYGLARWNGRRYWGWGKRAEIGDGLDALLRGAAQNDRG